MKSVSNEYKQQIKTFGKQIDSKIIYTINNEEVELGASDLNSITLSYEGNILKSVMKQLEIDSKEEIPEGTVINYQFGLKTRSGKNLFDKSNANIINANLNNNKINIHNNERTVWIKCEPNTTYTFTKLVATPYSRNAIAETTVIPAENVSVQNRYTSVDSSVITYTTSSTAQYIVWWFYSTGSTNYTQQQVLDSMQIEKGSSATSYEKYGMYEYIDYGNFVVNKVEKQEDKYSWIITCYDKMLYSMVDYEDLGVTYPISIRDYISALCTKIGLTFANSSDTFANYDREIQNELFLSSDGGSLDYTFRDVLDQLAEVTGSVICINDDDELEIRYPNDTEDEIDEHLLKDVNVKFGEKFGPVNSIVLSRSAESDNIYLSDDESIALNGLTEIKIKDNQFMNFNDRDEYLPDLLEVLDGLEFCMNDYSSTGITYYDLYDIYNVSVDEVDYKCLILNDTITVSRGLSEDIYTEHPDKSETDYKKADKTDRRINQAYIIVDKQNQEITSLTSRVTEVEGKTVDNYTKEEINQLVQTATEGVTNKFIQNGGNNILRNTGLWFEDTSNIEYLYPNNTFYPSDDLFILAEPYFEYWEGKVVRGQESKASNSNCLLLQSNTLSQNQQVRNGTYTLSFKYKKPIQLSTASVIINGEETELTEIDDTEFVKTFEVTSQFINLSFICDTDSGVEIYDLMLNAGEEKAEYSQNQNETTTNTVNISKGITITSSDTNTTFKADSDGIRIFNSRDLENPITKFTDIGMETKKATIEDTAEIVEVLFKKVGNNTWITKL